MVVLRYFAVLMGGCDQVAARFVPGYLIKAETWPWSTTDHGRCLRAGARSRRYRLR
jgi:hypothetical protein